MKKSFISSKNTPKDSNLSRRDFIKVAGVFVGSAALVACTPQGTSPSTPPPSTPTQIPEASPTSEPQYPEEIQSKFSGTDFTLGTDGKVYIKPEKEGDEQIEVKGLVFDRDGNGKLTYGLNENEKNIYYKDKTFDVDVNTLAVNKDKQQIFFKEKVENNEVAMDWIFDIKLEMLLPQVTNELHNTDLLHTKELEYLTGAEYKQLINRLYNEGYIQELNVGNESLVTEIKIGIFYNQSLGSINAYNGECIEFNLSDKNADEIKESGKLPYNLAALHKTKIKNQDGVSFSLIVATTVWKTLNSEEIKVLNHFFIIPDNAKTSFIATSSVLPLLNSNEYFLTGTVLTNSEENTDRIDGAKRFGELLGLNTDQSRLFAEYYYNNRDNLILGEDTIEALIAGEATKKIIPTTYIGGHRL